LSAAPASNRDPQSLTCSTWKRLDGFAAYLPRVPGFVCGQSRPAPHRGQRRFSIVLSTVPHGTPQATSSGSLLVYRTHGDISSRIASRRLGKDLQLPFRRWLYGLRLAQQNSGRSDAIWGKRSTWNLGSLAIFRIRVLIFSLEGYKCSTWNTFLRNC